MGFLEKCGKDTDSVAKSIIKMVSNDSWGTQPDRTDLLYVRDKLRNCAFRRDEFWCDFRDLIEKEADRQSPPFTNRVDRKLLPYRWRAEAALWFWDVCMDRALQLWDEGVR